MRLMSDQSLRQREISLRNHSKNTRTPGARVIAIAKGMLRYYNLVFDGVFGSTVAAQDATPTSKQPDHKSSQVKPMLTAPAT